METFDVYIRYLPCSIAKEDLFSMFSKCGKVVDGFVMPPSTTWDYTYGFVRYKSKEEAVSAVAQFNGMKLDTGTIAVELSNRTRGTIVKGRGGVVKQVMERVKTPTNSILKRFSELSKYTTSSEQEDCITQKLIRSLSNLKFDDYLRERMNLTGIGQLKSFTNAITGALSGLSRVPGGVCTNPQFEPEVPVTIGHLNDLAQKAKAEMMSESTSKHLTEENRPLSFLDYFGIESRNCTQEKSRHDNMSCTYKRTQISDDHSSSETQLSSSCLDTRNSCPEHGLKSQTSEKKVVTSYSRIRKCKKHRHSGFPYLCSSVAIMRTPTEDRFGSHPNNEDVFPYQEDNHDTEIQDGILEFVSIQSHELANVPRGHDHCEDAILSDKCLSPIDEENVTTVEKLPEPALSTHKESVRYLHETCVTDFIDTTPRQNGNIDVIGTKGCQGDCSLNRNNAVKNLETTSKNMPEEAKRQLEEKNSVRNSKPKRADSSVEQCQVRKTERNKGFPFLRDQDVRRRFHLGIGSKNILSCSYSKQEQLEAAQNSNHNLQPCQGYLENRDGRQSDTNDTACEEREDEGDNKRVIKEKMNNGHNARHTQEVLEKLKRQNCILRKQWEENVKKNGQKDTITSDETYNKAVEEFRERKSRRLQKLKLKMSIPGVSKEEMMKAMSDMKEDNLLDELTLELEKSYRLNGMMDAKH